MIHHPFWTGGHLLRVSPMLCFRNNPKMLFYIWNDIIYWCSRCRAACHVIESVWVEHRNRYFTRKVHHIIVVCSLDSLLCRHVAISESMRPSASTAENIAGQIRQSRIKCRQALNFGIKDSCCNRQQKRSIPSATERRSLRREFLIRVMCW